MNRDEALKELMNGKKIKASDWKKDRYIYIDKKGQIVDNKNKLFNIITSKKKNWTLYTEKKANTVTNNDDILKLLNKITVEISELKKANDTNCCDVNIDSEEIASYVTENIENNIEPIVVKAIKNNVPQEEATHEDIVKIFYGVTSLKEIRELFKEELLKCNDKREVAVTVTKYIPYCWMGARSIKTVARYYADMRNVIKDISDEFMDYALELFSVPTEVYERIKKADIKKVLDKIETDRETFEISDIENKMDELKKLVLKALELDENCDVETWENAGLPISKQQTVARARAYLFATYIAFATGRRITEILKSLELVFKNGEWFFKGILKKGFEETEVKAYSLDKDYELLSKLIKQIRKDIDTTKMTNQEVNSKFNHIFNRALKNITGLKYTFHDLREIFAEMAYLKFGKKSGTDREKEDFISDILGHTINKDRLVSANHYMTKEGK